jgi:TPR repeat protein
LALQEENNHTEALALIQPFADKGLAIAQHLVGTFHYYGRSVPEDLKKAVEWIQKAADQGYGESLSMLGYQYIRGQGVLKDLNRGLSLLEQAGKAGVGYAYFQLGEYYGLKSDEDNQYKAANYYIEGIKLDNRDCMRELALMYAKRNEHKKALELFEMALKLGDVDSAFNAGYMYEEGLGCDQNLELAFMLYQAAYKCGSIKALNNIGNMYLNGRHVKEDKQKAFECYLEASNKGDEVSQFNIGNMYYTGDMPQDLEVALAWFKKSLENGNQRAGKFIAEIEQIRNKKLRDLN